MLLKLVSPNDLTRAQVEALFTRADDIANGAAPNLHNVRVGMALFNTAFPLPIAAEAVLRDAGAQLISIASPDKVNSAGANVILFSSPETDTAKPAADKAAVSFLNAGDGTHENPVRALMDVYAIRTLKTDLQKIALRLWQCQIQRRSAFARPPAGDVWRAHHVPDYRRAFDAV